MSPSTLSLSVVALTLFAACGSSPSGGLDAGGLDANAPDATARDADPVDGWADDVSPADTGPDDSGPCPPVSGSVAVTATEIVTFVGDQGEVDVPEDFTSTTRVVLSLDGEGCFRTHAVAGDTGGSFVARDLPDDAVYYVPLATDVPSYFVTTEADVDLGSVRAGRPDVVAATDARTSLALALDGLAPITSDGELQVYSANAGLLVTGARSAIQPAPPLGATTLAGRIPWDAATIGSPILIDAARGDALAIFQLTSRPLGLESYTAIAKVYEAAPFTMVDGETTTLSGTFANPARTATAAIDWRRSELSRLVPSLMPPPQGLELLGVRAPEHGLFGAAPDLLFMESSMFSDLTADFTYGDVLPADHVPAASAYAAVVRRVALGTARPVGLIEGVLSWTLLAAAGPTVVGPIVGLPRAFAVDGLDATTDVTITSTTPRLSWMAPELGAPGAYLVLLFELTESGGNTQGRLSCRLRTVATEVRVPPGAMRSGATYVAQIFALAAPGADLARRPYAGSFPGGSGVAITAKITVP